MQHQHHQKRIYNETFSLDHNSSCCVSRVITDVIYVPKMPLPYVTHHVGTLWYLCVSFPSF